MEPCALSSTSTPISPNSNTRCRTRWLPLGRELLSLRDVLIQVTQVWEHLSKPGEACPVRFTDDEVKQHNEEKAEWDKACSTLSMLHDMLGINVQGWVTVDMFQATVEENQRLRKQFILGGEPDFREEAWKTWPFKDDDETLEWWDIIPDPIDRPARKADLSRDLTRHGQNSDEKNQAGESKTVL